MYKNVYKTLIKNCYRNLPESIQEQLIYPYIYLKKQKIQKLATPTVLIFFITARCNARCAHCFYWQEINNKSDELSLDEIEKIASSLQHPVHLSLTGGEPFLRKDIYDITKIFFLNNGCRNIGIASNGYLTDRIIDTCETVLQNFPLDSFSIQISLDGLEKTHDDIRGVKGGFKKTLQTIEKLKKVADKNANFSVSTSLTIQKRNFGEIEEFVKLLLPYEVPVKFALIRGQNFGTYCLPKNISNDIDPMEEDSPIVDLESLTLLFQKIEEMNNNSKYKFWSQRQQRKIEISLEMMKTQQKQLPCYAGKLDGVLYANGDVALCELTKPIGNIKNYDYNFKSIWNSELADKFRRKIQKCYCIHGCNLTTSMMFEPKIVASSLRSK